MVGWVMDIPDTAPPPPPHPPPPPSSERRPESKNGKSPTLAPPKLGNILTYFGVLKLL